VSSSSSWPTVANTTLADQVYLIIRNRVLQGELAPGSFLREPEVSAATGVSRTPVREALNRLASEGLLERFPHRGFRVPSDPWEVLLEVYPMVSALESLAVSLGIERIDNKTLEELTALNEKLKRAAAKENVEAMVDLNNRFHQRICAQCGNRRLMDLLTGLRDQVTLLDHWYYSRPEFAVHSYEEHDRILEALRAQRHDEARSYLRHNYARAHVAFSEERGTLHPTQD
jgi:DNA-binding GntR family transcriptional regulator